MRYGVLKTTCCLLAATLGLALMGCGPKHCLSEYDFSHLSAAAMVDAPPQAEVFTGSIFDIDGDNVLAVAIKAGTTLAKEITADQAQARLDSAMMRVDVPERIRQRTLRRCAEHLRLRAIPLHNRADFLFDLYVHNYGIDAEGWDAGVYFYIDLEVFLLDNATGREIWKTDIEEKLPVTRALFPGEGTVADDVISAVALAKLSVAEMAAGFRHLAAEAADRVALRLHHDYAESREQWQKKAAEVPRETGEVIETPERSAPERRDLLAELEPLYLPSTEQVSEVLIPPMNFLMIDGIGDPNTSQDYMDAVAVLYELSSALKYTVLGDQGIDYQVMPLEGLWWADDMTQFSLQNRESWKWTAMIMQPDFVTEQLVAQARAELSAKGGSQALEKIRFQSFYEGMAAQILYIGPYAEEGPTIGKIHGHIFENGHRPIGKHHEIYLSDPAKTRPEDLKTVIRQPFE